MKKTILKIIAIFAVSASTLFITGCPVTVTFTERTDDSLSYHFSTVAGSNINELISSFDKSMNGSTNGTTVFDTIEIERALFQMGLTNVHATTTKLQNQQEVLDITFVSPEKKFPFIKLIKDSSGAAKQLQLTLSPEILQDLITKQNSVIQKYADLLMAPCFTNDSLSKDEYIELTASLYGNEIAKELTEGEIKLVLKNAQVKKITQGITIPLIDILTLTSEKTFTVDF